MAIVAAYNLDGTSVDSVSGVTSIDTSITYSAANGKVGQGAGFNGTTSRIDNLRLVNTFSYIQNTGIFSINMWMKRTSIGAVVHIMGNTGTSIEKGFFLRFNADNSISIQIFNGSGVVVLSYTSGAVISDTNIHMWSFIGNGSNVKIYRDTTLVATSGAIGTLSTGDSTRVLRLGQIMNTITNWYSGSIDIVYFYNHELSTGEMNQLYNGGNGLQLFNSGMFQFFLQ
jgi:hypothetical protein